MVRNAPLDAALGDALRKTTVGLPTLPIPVPGLEPAGTGETAMAVVLTGVPAAVIRQIDAERIQRKQYARARGGEFLTCRWAGHNLNTSQQMVAW